MQQVSNEYLSVKDVEECEQYVLKPNWHGFGKRKPTETFSRPCPMCHFIETEWPLLNAKTWLIFVWRDHTNYLVIGSLFTPLMWAALPVIILMVSFLANGIQFHSFTVILLGSEMQKYCVSCELRRASESKQPSPSHCAKSQPSVGCLHLLNSQFLLLSCVCKHLCFLKNVYVYLYIHDHDTNWQRIRLIPHLLNLNKWLSLAKCPRGFENRWVLPLYDSSKQSSSSTHHTATTDMLCLCKHILTPANVTWLYSLWPYDIPSIIWQLQ